jgi:hypothetical protein
MPFGRRTPMSFTKTESISTAKKIPTNSAVPGLLFPGGVRMRIWPKMNRAEEIVNPRKGREGRVDADKDEGEHNLPVVGEPFFLPGESRRAVCLAIIGRRNPPRKMSRSPRIRRHVPQKRA